MNIEVYKVGEELDAINYSQVQDEISAILEKSSSVVLDMTDCRYVSSSGLRVLLYSEKVASSKGQKLYLVGLSAQVKDIMEVTGFNNFFDSFKTIEEFMQHIK